ncbi:probable serine/threonine-protein kinase SIK1B [Pollicipes pollicipes]|uniref:probable serine/threonine-protein kinase SIK1B n=1 Tax=Pollicipes pollicipes TaxID=41117 RepID=UPI001884D76A|nr:probable serine/threonine-protein kinase SIK1B [Pollicipes pollicipes]
MTSVFDAVLMFACAINLANTAVALAAPCEASHRGLNLVRESLNLLLEVEWRRPELGAPATLVRKTMRCHLDALGDLGLFRLQRSTLLSITSTIMTYMIVMVTPYSRLISQLRNDERLMKEMTLGKRVGFYRFYGDLGTGNFSQVKLGVHQLTNERVAVKILSKAKLDQKTQRMLAREIANMDKVHHPNIIRLYEVLETLSKIHLVMEHAPGGELFHKITTEGRLSERRARPLVAQLVSAVQHMHLNNMIHRDIKAENVFFSRPDVVKLGDFGFSTLVCEPDQHLTTFCGSPPYAAPELFRDDYYTGAAVDAWALGILIFFMVAGAMPFRAGTVTALKRQILSGAVTMPDSKLGLESEALESHWERGGRSPITGVYRIMMHRLMRVEAGELVESGSPLRLESRPTSAGPAPAPTTDAADKRAKSKTRILKKTSSEYLEALEQVLQRLSDGSLRLQRKKRRFGASSVVYLGHRVEADGVKLAADGTEPRETLQLLKN